MSFIRHIHNYTEYNEEWNVFSAFNPSKCTYSFPTQKEHLLKSTFLKMFLNFVMLMNASPHDH